MVKGGERKGMGWPGGNANHGGTQRGALEVKTLGAGRKRARPWPPKDLKLRAEHDGCDNNSPPHHKHRSNYHYAKDPDNFRFNVGVQSSLTGTHGRFRIENKTISIEKASSSSSKIDETMRDIMGRINGMTWKQPEEPPVTTFQVHQRTFSLRSSASLLELTEPHRDDEFDVLMRDQPMQSPVEVSTESKVKVDGYSEKEHSQLMAQALEKLSLEESGNLGHEEFCDILINETLITPEIKAEAAHLFERIVKDLVQEVVQLSKSTAPLGRVQRDEAERLIYGIDPGEIVITKFQADIHGRDLATLRDGTWLNDEIINFQIKMMQERMNSNLRNPDVPNPQKMRCIFFNTFFFVKLSDGGRGYNYNLVRRWSKKQKKLVHESEVDKVIIPINVNSGTHWCLSVINFKEKRFEYYDSMGGSGRQYLTYLRRYVIDENKKYRNEDYDLSEWKDYAPDDIPCQTNGYDCGVFTSKYADYVSENRTFDFTQADMRDFRRRMALQISQGSML